VPWKRLIQKGLEFMEKGKITTKRAKDNGIGAD